MSRTQECRAQSNSNWQIAASFHLNKSLGAHPERLWFLDSAYGFALIDEKNGYPWWIRTTDGGVTWDTINRGESRFGIVGPQIGHALSRKDLFVQLPDVLQVSHDSGVTWQSLIWPWAGQHSSLLHMFDQEHGIIVGVLGTGPNYLEVWRITDSGRFFEQTSNIYWRSHSFVDGTVVDSVRIFALLQYSYDAGAVLARSTDGGVTFDSLTHFRYAFSRQMIVRDGGQTIYIVGSRLVSTKPSVVYSTCYFASHDSGKTWREDSTFYGYRMQMLAVPAKDILWALVRHSTDNAFSRPDTIYYSSDDGNTWIVNRTFDGDSVVSMAWPDARHGYVLTQKGDSAFVYSYLEKGDAAVTRAQPSLSSVRIVSTPVHNQLRYECSAEYEGCRALVMDVVGRSRSVPSAGHELTVDQLEPGVYWLILQSRVSHETARASFIVE